MDANLSFHNIRNILHDKGYDFTILHCSLYGSSLYGTWSETSDYDVFIIINEDINDIDIHDEIYKINDKDTKIDLTIRSIKRFNEMVKFCDVNAVEIMMSSVSAILFEDVQKTVKVIYESFNPKNPETALAIRKSFSAKSDWAEVRARKKLIDKEYKVAIRSVYHSYRIIKFAVQIGKHGKIIDWTEANDLFDELKVIPYEQFTTEMFKEIHKKWVKSGLLTEFKGLFPK
ncbi:MAG: hypothetical protein Terrestrivirus6_64 [Terrestrivirus sp.]|jgi:predicted nucleotidyltransferase|uniref:Polymerase nucleotidyl transferase domain-containing protein n=1 Tax=Terrestrivirus sp. TaxID=2487775 RepID=A0A3G4ZNK3_9VIRU|nr:MAG: hypothetical protein Terrestrivirus6_64 [Terrestrivirus sp.]